MIAKTDWVTTVCFSAAANFVGSTVLATMSELIKKAQAGETVVITSGREKKPVARLEAIKPKKQKRLGALETPGFVLGDAFWEPLPEEELRLWEGETD